MQPTPHPHHLLRIRACQQAINAARMHCLLDGNGLPCTHDALTREPRLRHADAALPERQVHQHLVVHVQQVESEHAHGHCHLREASARMVHHCRTFGTRTPASRFGTRCRPGGTCQSTGSGSQDHADETELKCQARPQHICMHLGSRDGAAGTCGQLLKRLQPVVVLPVHRHQLRVQHQGRRGPCSMHTTCILYVSMPAGFSVVIRQKEKDICRSRTSACWLG